METVVAPSSWKNILLERISSKQIQSGVIGLGMVGLPLSLEMAGAGFDVTGIDIDPVKIETLQSGRSYLGMFSLQRSQSLFQPES